MSPRLERLRHRLALENLDGFLVTQADNRRYLSGFTGSAGALLITQKKAILATDFRYIEQAGLQAPGFEVLPVKGEIAHWLPSLATYRGVRRLGLEAHDLSYAVYTQTAQATAKDGLELVPTHGWVEGLRAVKEPEELALLERAAALTDEAIECIMKIVKPGMTEKELAWETEKFLRERGSEGLPFDPIVAAGPRSAMPHARATERIIRSGEPVLLDIGARIGGYSSDLSRTIILGDRDETFSKIYAITLEAQTSAIDKVRVGMTGAQADALAREIIEQAGYGASFGHSLGHGVGLGEHEEPRLGPGSTSILEEGMVFTVEPGIYLTGWGGVRIEDMVVLAQGKARPLTSSPKG